mmetsp:Transcript_4944/g.10392  ORF Transcript_4944/g.10392 Transcript_4944/m.10392 type:complete len:248 (-) Transcript_4944:45-788(-)
MGGLSACTKQCPTRLLQEEAPQHSTCSLVLNEASILQRGLHISPQCISKHSHILTGDFFDRHILPQRLWHHTLHLGSLNNHLPFQCSLQMPTDTRTNSVLDKVHHSQRRPHFPLADMSFLMSTNHFGQSRHKNFLLLHCLSQCRCDAIQNHLTCPHKSHCGCIQSMPYLRSCKTSVFLHRYWSTHLTERYGRGAKGPRALRCYTSSGVDEAKTSFSNCPRRYLLRTRQVFKTLKNNKYCQFCDDRMA